jgi:GNAT superfamily N-acetyltransferase
MDRPCLFAAGAFRAFELSAAEIPTLQRFLDANPEYCLAVNGEPPGAREAHEEFHGTPPAGMTWSNKWLIGFADEADTMAGFASVVSDLVAPGVWHIGLFIVATSRHGSGAAQAMYRPLEAWAVGQGAQWLRLGVVAGNARAERFWERAGYAEVRRRGGVEIGRRTPAVRVMVKPLAGGTLPRYLALVVRDRPEHP